MGYVLGAVVVMFVCFAGYMIAAVYEIKDIGKKETDEHAASLGINKKERK